jgi:hypothetical protein
LGSLAKDVGQSHHRYRTGRDHVGQDLTGSDRRELIDIADDQQSGLI